MYNFIFHLLLAFSWAIFLLTFIKSIQHNSFFEAKIFGILSLLTMILVLIVGTKMMLADHSIIKSGKWIHLKLSFDIILMLENLYLFKFIKNRTSLSTKQGNLLYLFSFIAFIIMISLTMFKPF